MPSHRRTDYGGRVHKLMNNIETSSRVADQPIAIGHACRALRANVRCIHACIHTGPVYSVTGNYPWLCHSAPRLSCACQERYQRRCAQGHRTAEQKFHVCPEPAVRRHLGCLRSGGARPAVPCFKILNSKHVQGVYTYVPQLTRVASACNCTSRGTGKDEHEILLINIVYMDDTQCTRAAID